MIVAIAWSALLTLGGAVAVGQYRVAEPPPAAQMEPAGRPVSLDRDYYLSVRLVEVSDRNPDGTPWDSWSDSGPDIFVEIFWKGSRVYRSTTKRDTFVAQWSVSELRLGELALAGGRTSVDDLIQAARVHIRPEDTVTVRIYDADLLRSTLISEKTFRLTDLHEGEESFSFDAPGVIRLGLSVRAIGDPVDLLH